MQDLGNDEAHTEHEANAETVEKTTEEPMAEETQPETVPVVDLSSEENPEGRDQGNGEENQDAVDEEHQGGTGEEHQGDASEEPQNDAGEGPQGDVNEEPQVDASTASVQVEEQPNEALSIQQPQAQDNTVARVTSSKHRSKEDLEILKQTDPVSYLNAIIESKSSSDTSQEIPTLSGKSTETSPLDDALAKVKAQFFKRDLMKTLEGDPTAPSCLKEVLNAVDFEAVAPEISDLIMELHSMIDQVSADYRRQRTFNSQLEVLHGKSSSAWTAVSDSTSRIAELSKQKASAQERVDAIERENVSFRAQIAEIEAKINANTVLQEEILSTIPDAESQTEIKQGLEFAERAQSLDAQIAKLEQEKSWCKKRLELQQAKYLRLRNSLTF